MDWLISLDKFMLDLFKRTLYLSFSFLHFSDLIKVCLNVMFFLICIDFLIEKLYNFSWKLKYFNKFD